MASTYSSNLRVELQTAGENRNAWGPKANTSFQLIEAAIAGYSSVSMGDANYSLTTNNGSSDQARSMLITLSGAHTAVRTLTIPAVSKAYVIRNATTGGYAVTVSNGTNTVSVGNGEWKYIWTDGTNMYASPDMASTYITASSTSTLTNKTLTSPTINGTTAYGSGAVLSFNAGDTTITHSASQLTFAAGLKLFTRSSGATNHPIGVTNSNDSASVATAYFEGDRTTMGANDAAYIDLRLSDSAGNQDPFARIKWQGTTVTSTSEVGKLIFGIGAGGSIVDEVELTATALSPVTNDGNALGTATLKWADLFLADGAVINFNNGNMTITHSAGTLAISSGTVTIGGSAVLKASDVGSTVQAYAATYVKTDTAATFTKGYAATSYNAGTKSSGTFTPASSDGNFQYAQNNGAHTLAPPATDCTIVIQYTNGATPGAITTSGFTKVIGAFTTTVGDDFFCYITKCNTFSYLNIVALQ